MQEWNAVISVREHGFRQAFDEFGDFGEVKRTGFFNILLLRARDVAQMLETLRERAEKSPESLAFLARLIPLTRTFIFNSPEEFEDRARTIILGWAQDLAGKSFFVRIRRRGFRGRIQSMDEERHLDTLLLEELEKSGKPGKISFEDPDAVIAIETVGTWAGLALFTGRRKSGIRSFGLSDRKRVLPVVCVKAIGNLLNNNFRKKVALIRNFQKERCR